MDTRITHAWRKFAAGRISRMTARPNVTGGVAGDRSDHGKTLSLRASPKSTWSMRSDDRRVLLFEQQAVTRNITSMGILHPSEAVVLALFDGTRDIEEIERLVADIFDIEPHEACVRTHNVCRRWKDALQVGSSALTKRYNPLDFVIPASQIDLARRKLYRPISFIGHIHDDCMRQCIYCNVQKRATCSLELLPVHRWMEIADECASLGVVDVVLGGGDPFMHRDVTKIIHGFVKNDIQPFVSTKSLISDRRAKEIVDIGLQQIQVSIDAPIPELADSMVGSPRYFYQITQSIPNLLKAGIRVRTNTVITNRNYRLLPELVRMLSDLGVSSMGLSQMGVSMHVPGTPSLLLNPDQGAWLEAEVKKLRTPLDVRFEYSLDACYKSPKERGKAWKNRAICSAGRWGIVMHSDGKVTLCDEMPLESPYIVGDLTRQSIKEVWDSPKITDQIQPERERFEGTACYDCAAFDSCHNDFGRCFRDALKAFGTFYAPDPDCPRAPKGIRLQ